MKYASNTIQNRYAWSINAYHGELVGAKTGVDAVRRLKLPPSETVREAFHRPKAWYYAVTAVEPVFTLQVRQPLRERPRAKHHVGVGLNFEIRLLFFSAPLLIPTGTGL